MLSLRLLLLYGGLLVRGALLVHVGALLPPVHHVLLLVVCRLLVVLRVLLLHMMPHVVHRLRRVQRGTSRRPQHAVLGHRHRLQLTTSVDGRLVSIGGGGGGHVHAAGAVRPVSLIPVHLLLLGAVVAGGADVHPVVGGEARVGHALRGLAARRRPAVVVRGDGLPQAHHRRVAAARVRLGLHAAAALRHLDGGAVMLVLVRVLRAHDTPVPHVRHVRIGEI